jgi:hypothetical protein
MCMGKGGKRQNCDSFACQADLKAKLYVCLMGTMDGAVSTATGYGLGNCGVRVSVQVEARIFSTLHHLDWFWHPHILLGNRGGGGGCFWG